MPSILSRVMETRKRWAAAKMLPKVFCRLLALMGNTKEKESDDACLMEGRLQGVVEAKVQYRNIVEQSVSERSGCSLEGLFGHQDTVVFIIEVRRSWK